MLSKVFLSVSLEATNSPFESSISNLAYAFIVSVPKFETVIINTVPSSVSSLISNWTSAYLPG